MVIANELRAFIMGGGRVDAERGLIKVTVGNVRSAGQYQKTVTPNSAYAHSVGLAALLVHGAQRKLPPNWAVSKLPQRALQDPEHVVFAASLGHYDTLDHVDDAISAHAVYEQLLQPCLDRLTRCYGQWWKGDTKRRKAGLERIPWEAGALIYSWAALTKDRPVMIEVLRQRRATPQEQAFAQYVEQVRRQSVKS